MYVPFEKLSAQALRGIIEEFVLREGTEYGETEFTLEQKISQVKKQLENGQALISFDPETETCSIVCPS